MRGQFIAPPPSRQIPSQPPAAMHTVAIQRLLWKETRTLAGLWGILLALLALLFLTAPLVVWSFGSDLSFQPIMMVLVLSGCFALAGSGVLFAGECEDGTIGLLKQLPIRPRDLLVAKCGVLVLACGTFVLAGLLIALVGEQLLGGLSAVGLKLNFGVDGVYLRSLFGCLAWGTFFSLRRDRVIAAVGWGVCFELITVGLISNVFADQREALKGPLHWGVTGSVLAIDLWLGWQWCRRGSTTSGRGLLSKSRWLARPVMSAQEFLAKFWLRGLVCCASLGSPAGRWIGVSVWRELRTLLPALLVWGVCGIVALLLGAAGGGWRTLNEVFVGWFLATPLLAGLMISLGERRGDTATFVAIHGISPAGFWLVRHILWGGCALVFALAGWMVLFYGLSAAEFIYREFRHLVPGHIAWSPYSLGDLPSDLVLLALSLAGSIFISLFAFGQMCGLWFRSVLVSLLTAVLLSVGVLLWHQAVLDLDVPPLLTTWPIALLWLYATYRQMPVWLNGDRSRRTLLRRAGWTIAPPMLTLVLLSLSRRYQIPEPPLRLDRSGPSAAVQAEAREVIEAAVKMLPDDLPILLENRIEAQIVLSMHAELDRLRSDPPINLNTLQSLKFYLLSHFQYSRINRATERDAARLAYEFDVLLAAHRVSRIESFYYSSLWPEFGSGLNHHVDICKMIAAWANREDQTVEQLERAILLLEAEFAHPVDLRPMIANWERHMLERIATGRPPQWEGAWQPTPGERFGQALLSLLNEPTRQRRLVRSIAEVAIPRRHARARRMPELVDPGAGEYRYRDDAPSYKQLQRWSETSLGEVGHHISSMTSSLGHVGDYVHRSHTAESVCLTIVALQAHRLRHGEFPEDVVELLDGPLDQLPTYQGSLFEFRRQGYPQPMVLGLFEVLPAGQPLLTVRSDRDFGRSVVALNDMTVTSEPELGSDDVSVSATRLSGSNLSHDIAQALAASYHQQHPKRIAFIEPWGTVDVRTWFCPSAHNYKSGRYVDPDGE